MSQITIEFGGSYAPCCYIICKVIDGDWDIYDDKNTVLIQTDWDHPSVAADFGWTGDIDKAGAIGLAGEYLDDIAGTGKMIEDPGYFT